MTSVNNPRFPHRCRILRYVDVKPMKDEKYFLSENGNGPSDFNEDFSNDFMPRDTINVIYQGVCRSDNRDTISDNGEVIASYRTLSLPTVQQDWTEETIPQEGVFLIVILY